MPPRSPGPAPWIARQPAWSHSNAPPQALPRRPGALPPLYTSAPGIGTGIGACPPFQRATSHAHCVTTNAQMARQGLLPSPTPGASSRAPGPMQQRCGAATAVDVDTGGQEPAWGVRMGTAVELVCNKPTPSRPPSASPAGRNSFAGVAPGSGALGAVATPPARSKAAGAKRASKEDMAAQHELKLAERVRENVRTRREERSKRELKG